MNEHVARVAIDLLVGEHEHASTGTRAVVASFLDLWGLDLKSQGLVELASYAWGRADGLRRPSRSRQERQGVVH